jgi:hypothetical protein
MQTLNAHLVEVWRTLCSLVDAMSRLQYSQGGLLQKHHKTLYTSFASINAEPKAKVVISPEIVSDKLILVSGFFQSKSGKLRKTIYLEVIPAYWSEPWPHMYSFLCCHCFP